MPIRQRADWEYTERQKLLMKGKPTVKKNEQTPINAAIRECDDILKYLSSGGRDMVLVANSFHVIKSALENAPEHRDTNRFEIVSEPGAAIEVTRINLTDDERESLSINKRLSDLGQVCKCGHDKNIHHVWCGYWNAGCDCRGYQNK